MSAVVCSKGMVRDTMPALPERFLIWSVPFGCRRDLSALDNRDYIKTVKCLLTTRALDRSLPRKFHRYDEFTYTHSNVAEGIHGVVCWFYFYSLWMMTQWKCPFRVSSFHGIVILVTYTKRLFKTVTIRGPFPYVFHYITNAFSSDQNFI